MKKLHLIRHAKSSWSDETLPDIERPLNKRGLKSCPIMAQQIRKAGCSFEHVFCSPAVRAQTTIEHIAHHLKVEHDLAITWKVDRALYTFEAENLLTWCRTLNDAITEVVIVGHNNAITDFTNQVGDHTVDNVPTCGYVQLALHNPKWAELSANSAELMSFLKPKMFM